MATNPNQKAIDPFVLRLQAVRQEAYERGLYATARFLDGAVSKVGWELAGHAEKGRFETREDLKADLVRPAVRRVIQDEMKQGGLLAERSR